jgi:hypothetical protein
MSGPGVGAGAGGCCKHLAQLASLAHLHTSTGLTIPHFHRPTPNSTSATKGRRDDLLLDLGGDQCC